MRPHESITYDEATTYEQDTLAAVKETTDKILKKKETYIWIVGLLLIIALLLTIIVVMLVTRC